MSRFLFASEQLHCVPAIVGAMLPNFRQGVVVAPIRPIKGGSDLIFARALVANHRKSSLVRGVVFSAYMIKEE